MKSLASGFSLVIVCLLPAGCASPGPTRTVPQPEASARSVSAALEQVAKLTSSDAVAEDWFGFRLGIDGDTIVVAARDFAGGVGSAYIFERNLGGDESWGEAKILDPADLSAGAAFGHGARIDGDTVVVGAVRDDAPANGSGSAYVFQRDQGGAGAWGQVRKLVASDGAAGDSFGTSVGISGDTIIVGARFDDDLGSASGSAYVFERDEEGADQWGEVAKLLPDGRGQFGLEVAIDGDTAFVPSNLENAGTGAVYIFERNEGGPGKWGRVQKLTASDAAAGDEFGRDVAIHGDTAVIGTDQDSAGPGKAYIFERDLVRDPTGSTWSVRKTLSASDPAVGDDYGTRVAIYSDTVVVGSHDDDDAGTDSGSAYVYQRDEGGPDNWGETQKLAPSDASARDDFGFSVALWGDTVVVGSRRDDDECPADPDCDSGSAYVFCPDSDGDGVCDSGDVCPGSDDSADTDADGVPDGCDLCPGDDDSADADGDGVPDGCDLCQGDDASGDTDSDGVCDDLDACPGFDDSADADGDGVPDGCDLCQGDDASGDTDSDGVCDDLDCADDDPDTAFPDNCGVCGGDDSSCSIFSDGFESGDTSGWP